jgi:ABC-type multidrug transport system ATPase subunit
LRSWHEVGTRSSTFTAYRRPHGQHELTTHHLDEAEALASRVVVIERGRIVADGSVAAIKAAAGLTRIRFRAPPRGLPDRARRDGVHMLILARHAGSEVTQLVRDGVPLVDLEVRPVTLDEALDALRSRCVRRARDVRATARRVAAIQVKMRGRWRSAARAPPISRRSTTSLSRR